VTSIWTASPQGWTQRRLAERLRVPEQQVQRWEAHEYHGVGIERLAEISDALGVTVEERFVATAPVPSRGGNDG
jgi:transcriptional regulator with XRE-family HTH domain